MKVSLVHHYLFPLILLGLLAGCTPAETATGPISEGILTLSLDITTDPARSGLVMASISPSSENGLPVEGLQGEVRFDPARLQFLALDSGDSSLTVGDPRAARSGSVRLLAVDGKGLSPTAIRLWFAARDGAVGGDLTFLLERAEVGHMPITRATVEHTQRRTTLPAPPTPAAPPDSLMLAQWVARHRTWLANFAGQLRPGLRYGDVNLDGQLNVLDALVVARVALGISPLLDVTNDASVAGNVRPSNAGAGGTPRPGSEPGTTTPDGRIDVSDVVALTVHLLGAADPVVGQLVPGRGPLSSARVALISDIVANRTLSRDTVYELGDAAHPSISVRNGASLTVRPGTRVEAWPGTRLIIERTGRLAADGSLLEPIIFTCRASVPAPGCWGGITLQGFAPLNAGTFTSPAARGNGRSGCLESRDGATLYGGCDVADSSGVLRYTRIEFAGDGLMLQGAGDRTTVDWVQVSRGAAVGVRVVGGTVGLRHLLLSANATAGLDWTAGWTGKGQFLAIQSDPATSAVGLRGASGVSTATPRSAPQLYNLTIASGAVAMRFSTGTAGTIRNLVLARPTIGLDVDDLDTCQQLTTGALSLKQLLIAGAGATGDGDIDPGNCLPYISPSVESDLLRATTTATTTLAGAVADSQLVRPFDLFAPDFRPLPAALVGRLAGTAPPSTGFFDPTATWLGAFAPSPGALLPWYAGWTDPAPPAGPAATVIVDPTLTYQTMVGWEAALSVGWVISPSTRARLIHDAVADLGITRLRLEIAGNYVETAVDPTGTGCTSKPPGSNDDNDPLHVNPAGFHWYCIDQKVVDWVLPLRAEVAARGEPFVLNACYVGFDSSLAFQQSSPAEYAEFTVAALDHLRQTYGLVPDIWELRLEPDNGYRLTGPLLGQLVASAGPRMRAAGYSRLLFGVPSTLDPNSVTSDLASMLAVPGTAPYLGEVTYHRYVAPLSPTLTGIAAAARAAGLRTAMLEHIGANAAELYEDLTQADVSSWARYALAGPFGGPNGGSQLYYVDPVTDTYSLRGSAYELRQYFKYVRPGAVRIGANSTDATVHPVAFRDPLGRIVVVLNADAGATLTAGGLPAGTYEVSYTTAAELGRVVGLQTIAPGQGVTATIPAAGVLTIAPR